MESVSTPRLARRLLLAFSIIAGVVAVGLYVVIAWAIPRGFDWSDESWTFSLVASNRNTDNEVWGFQYLLHPLFGILGQSVVAFRVLRLLCYFLLALYFVAIAFAIARARGWRLSLPAWLLVLSVSQIGSFFAWSYPPRGVGYNELASWLVQLGTGALLLVVAGRLMSRPVVGPRVAVVLWAGEGAVTLFLLAAKVTTGILFACVVVVALLVKDPAVGPLRRILATLVGAVVAFAIMLASGLPIAVYVRNLLSVAFDKNAQAASGHPVGTLLQQYQTDLLSSLITVGLSLGLLVVLAVVVFVSARSTLRMPLKAVLIIGSVLVEVVLIFTVYRWVHLNAEFLALGYFSIFLGAGSLLLLILGAVVAFTPARGAGETRWPVRTWVVGCLGIAILVGTPFLSAAGTNNPLSGELLYSAQIWASTLAVLLVVGGMRLVDRGLVVSAVPLSLALVLLVASAIGVRHSEFQVPFRNIPFQDQNTSTTAPALRGLLLPKGDAEWTGWLASKAKTLKATNTPTISMISPGALFVFNNSAYTDPWLLDISPVSYSSITVSCKKDPTGPLLILLPPRGAGNKSLFRSVTAALAKCGIAFPQDFVQVAKYTPGNPASDITIVKLKTKG